MPEVILDVNCEDERKEEYKNLTSNLTVNVVDNFSSFDGILINMITGHDISNEQLKYIRKNFNGLIYFDVHSLARGFEKNKERIFRPIPNIEDWLSCVDIVQCNKNELKTIFEGNEYDVAKFIFKFGVKLLLVTKAENGSSLYTLKENKIFKVDENPLNIVLKNKIGCGDIFGATFFYNYLKTNNYLESLKFANYTGGFSASLQNLTNVEKINYDFI